MSQKFIVRFYLSLMFVMCLPFISHAQGWVSCLNTEISTCAGAGHTPEVFICDFWGDEEACFWCIDEDDIIVKEQGCGGPGYATAPICDQPECTGGEASPSGNGGRGGGFPGSQVSQVSSGGSLKLFGGGSRRGEKVPSLNEVLSSVGIDIEINEATKDYSVNFRIISSGDSGGDSAGLNYSSQRDQQKPVNYTLKYKFLDTTPIFASSYAVEFKIAGRTINFTNPASTHEINWTWDGLDSLGQPAKLPQTLEASITMAGETISQDFILGFEPNDESGDNGGWGENGRDKYNIDTNRLYMYHGGTLKTDKITLPGGEIGVLYGSEMKVFDSNSKHVRTVGALTGETLKSYTYDLDDRLIKITDAYGNETKYLRDMSGVLTGIENADGLVTLVNIVSGKLMSITTPEGDIYSMTYHTNGMLESITKPSGKTTTFHIDVNGNLTKVSNSGGSFLDYLYSYDAFLDASVSTRTTAEGRQEVVGVNRSLNHMSTKRVSPLGVETTTVNVFGAFGRSSVEQADYSLEVEYEGDTRFGAAKRVPKKITEKHDTLTRVSNFSYGKSLSNPSDPFSIITLTESVTTNLKTISSVYTGSTKTWVTTSDEGRTLTTQIDDEEKPVSVQVGSLTAVDYEYDTRGRLEKVLQGVRETEYTYNSQGYVSQVENALGQITSYTYDDDGKLETVTLPDTRVLTYKYDSAGNLLELTPDGKPKHNFLYNVFELIQEYLPPVLGGTPRPINYTYNDDEELISVTRSDGTTVNYNKNATTGVLDSITTGLTTLYEYDYSTDNGFVEEAGSKYEIGNSMTYLGQLPESTTWYDISSTPFQLGKLTNTYNNDFLITTQTVQGTALSSPQSITYTYDDDGLITDAGNASYSYRSTDPLLSNITLGLLEEDLSYNAFGELTGKETSYNSNLVIDIAYTRDALGRIATKTESDGINTHVYEYIYDVSGRLEEVKKDATTISTYVYDDNNNRTGGSVGGVSTTATYDDQDRLLTYNTLSFGYNHNGERTSRVDSSTSQTTGYTYNALGQLESVTLPSTDVIEYAYDGLGRRVGRSLNSTVTHMFVYEGDLRIIADLNPSTGDIETRYVYVSQSHSPDYMIRGGQEYEFVKDHLGSVKLVVRVSDGVVMQNITYDEFGRVLSDSNPGFQPFGFAGGVYDAQTGLTKFGVRDYDAEVGRWLTKDPILFHGGDANLYGYVMMDPVNFVDPEGKTGWKNEIPSAQQASNSGFAGDTIKYFGGIYATYWSLDALKKLPTWRLKCIGILGIGIGTYFTIDGAKGLSSVDIPVAQ